MSLKKEPLVSIVLPVYNGEKFLADSIESCIGQTFTNWELLIIDDGSTDRSAQIAKEYEQKDERIHYYKNEENMMLPRALNRGFSLAKGDYLTWTSDDNYYRPEALEKMVAKLNEGNAEFVFTAFSYIDEGGKETRVHRIDEDPFHLIWKYNIVGACFLYTRRVLETIGGYEHELFLCEDYDYWLRIFAKYPVAYLDENLYAYRMHSGTLTSTRLKGQYEALEKVLIKNLNARDDLGKLDWFYAYRGLHRSRRLEKSFTKRYEYLPKWFCYKLWHLFQ